MDWDPECYSRFSDHRSRPAVELLTRVAADDPSLVLDLGCGPGVVTGLLRRRWPSARTIAVDNSAEMLQRACASDTGTEWVEADIAAWEPPAVADVVFSNAALHWLDDHAASIPKIVDWVIPGGWFAIQMPRNPTAPYRDALMATVGEHPSRSRLKPLVRKPVLSPAEYYEILAPMTDRLDIWETEYLQLLEGENPVAAWTEGAALRPTLAELDGAERAEFVAAYRRRISEAYPPRLDGTTLFPFRRLFIVARR
jgi:trans-aconitate 2-methyltransferase